MSKFVLVRFLWLVKNCHIWVQDGYLLLLLPVPVLPTTLVHHISATIGPTASKFGMLLPYGLNYDYIFWIFEFPIFWCFFGFSEKHLVFYSESYKVHRISATIGPTVSKFGVQLPYGLIYDYIFWIFEFPIFWCFFRIFGKRLSFYSESYKVHRISATIRSTVSKFAMQLPYGLIYDYIFWILEFRIFWCFFGFSEKT